MVERVLIVEDEQAIADNICFALRHECFDYHHTTLGQAALDWLEYNKADLIILDVGLLDINGFELCKRIRLTSQIPILFLTARTEEIDRIIGFEIGGDDYVAKPFSPRELMGRIKAILRRSQPRCDEHKIFEINESAFEITYLGQRLELTRYEYGVLQLLISHPAQVFSREQLLQRIWREPGASNDRVVDTHIKTLRTKLRAVSTDSDPLVTHRGLGYSLKIS